MDEIHELFRLQNEKSEAKDRALREEFRAELAVSEAKSEAKLAANSAANDKKIEALTQEFNLTLNDEYNKVCEKEVIITEQITTIVEQTMEIFDLTQDNERLTEANAKKDTKIQRLTDSITERDETIVELTRDTERLTQTIAEKDVTIVELTRENERLTQTIAERDETINELTEELNEFILDLRLRERINTFNSARIDYLTTVLERKNNEYEDLRTQLQNRNQQLTEKNAGLRKRVNEAAKYCDQLQRQIHGLIDGVINGTGDVQNRAERFRRATTDPITTYQKDDVIITFIEHRATGRIYHFKSHWSRIKKLRKDMFGNDYIVHFQARAIFPRSVLDAFKKKDKEKIELHTPYVFSLRRGLTTQEFVGSIRAAAASCL